MLQIYDFFFIWQGVSRNFYEIFLPLSSNNYKYIYGKSNKGKGFAMLSYSNFGADPEGSPASVHEVVEFMQNEYPDLVIDGEMQVNFALDKKLRDTKYPFTRLFGKDVNTLVFPNLTSANITQKLLQEMGDGEVIGPIQVGLKKPIHFTDIESSVRDIVNITRIAVVDAIVQEKREKK